MSDLFAPVCSITTTKRRRFFWAAWWSAPPSESPFRKPDSEGGGASTFDEARAAAERAAGRPLVVIEPEWARAWARVLRGQAAWTGAASHPKGRARSATEPAPAGSAPAASIWEVLGAPPTATAAELRLAFRKRAMETHPDQGGDAEAFRRLLRAYEEAKKRVRRPKRRP